MYGNPPANDSWQVGDHKLADMMSSYWVNFIATGDPNGKGLPQWQAYNTKNDGKPWCSAIRSSSDRRSKSPAGVLRQVLRGGDEEVDNRSITVAARKQPMSR